MLELLPLAQHLEAKLGVIQVMANRPGAGKTCLIGALFNNLTQEGKKAGYYKPFSTSPTTDGDVSFMSQQPSVEGSPRVPAPQLMPLPSAPSRNGPAISDTVGGLDAVADTTLIEGPDLTSADGTSWPNGYDPPFVTASGVVLLLQYEKGLDAGAVEILAGPIRERLIGVVINHAPIHRHLEIAERLITPLRNKGLPVLGAIPEDRFMLSVTVQQIMEHLNGSWVQEPQNTDAHVDRFLIGGNIMDSGPSYFGRYTNQAVITRAERPDIQMASLMCPTRCLVLTGGAEPTEYIRVEADKKGVPLISVAGGTIGTAEALNSLLEKANPYSLPKLQRFLKLMQENLDLGALNAALG